MATVASVTAAICERAKLCDRTVRKRPSETEPRIPLPPEQIVETRSHSATERCPDSNDQPEDARE